MEGAWPQRRTTTPCRSTTPALASPRRGRLLIGFGQGSLDRSTQRDHIRFVSDRRLQPFPLASMAKR